MVLQSEQQDLRGPCKAESSQPVYHREFQIHKSEDRRLDQMIFQGSTKFSILTRNVKAKLPWRHTGSASSPRASDIQPRCSAIWQRLRGILWHSWAGNNVRFTNVLMAREHAVEAGPKRSGNLVKMSLVSLGRTLQTQCWEHASYNLGCKLIGSRETIGPVPNQ